MVIGGFGFGVAGGGSSVNVEFTVQIVSFADPGI